MDMNPSIEFINEQVQFSLKKKLLLKSWIKKTIKNENHKQGPICFVFCNDGYLLKLNQKYLQHDYYTDILTFDHTDVDSKKNGIISGDLYISIDRVRDNSANSGPSFDTELRRVMVHGILHLLGYSDHSKREKERMKKKEDFYLSKF